MEQIAPIDSNIPALFRSLSLRHNTKDFWILYDKEEHRVEGLISDIDCHPQSELIIEQVKEFFPNFNY